MKQIPILFSTEMVQAIIEGRKTQTRRVVRDCKQFKDWDVKPSECYGVMVADDGSCATFLAAGDQGWTDIVECPYGKVGDVLWVRETWQWTDAKTTWDDQKPSTATVLFKASNDIRPSGVSIYDYPCTNTFVVSHEVAEDVEHLIDSEEERGIDRWRPSIHMPKAAARIWLQVTGVRVERLQDISEGDAKAEGVWMPDRLKPLNIPDYYKTAFKVLWKGINGADSWAANPWVWVIEFKILSTTGKPENL